MLGQKIPKKRSPLASCGMSLVTFIIVMVALGGGCFLLCSLLFVLNGGSLTT